MTARQSRRAPRAQAQTPTLPPLAVALFRLAEPNYNGVPESFAQAYAAMPAILDTFARGDDEKADEITIDGLIAELSGFDAARKQADRNPDLDQTEPKDFDENHAPARIIAILNRVNEDYPTDLTAPVGNAGFWVGMAFACYVLTTGGAR